MFYQLSNSVGSGKTQATLEHLRDNIDAPCLYVAPTIQLCEEIHRRCLEVIGQRREYNMGDSFFLIVGNDNHGRVYPRALDACTANLGNPHPIIIITTKTFLYLLKELPDHYKGRFRVFVDEGLPVIETVQFSPGELGDYLRYFAQDEDGFITPESNASREILEWAAFTPQRLAARRLDHLDQPAFKKISDLVVSGNYDVFLRRTDRSMEVVGILSPEPLRAFRSVTLIVAIFEQTLLPSLWRQRHGIEFEPFELGVELYDAHAHKGPLMDIWHVLAPGDNASQQNLQRDFETGEPNEREPTRQVIFSASQEINTHFGDGVFCWTANNDFCNPGNVLEGVRMPASCAGLDGFRRHTRVASLLCINPQPWVRDVMLELFNFEDEELFELWRFTHTYQVIGRCAVRTRESEERIQVVVISQRCAEQLQALFRGATIEGQLTNFRRYSIERRDPQVQEEFGVHYTKADNSAYSKYRKRVTERGEVPLEKIAWFRELRFQRIAQR